MSKPRIQESKAKRGKLQEVPQRENGKTQPIHIGQISYSTPIKEIGICSNCRHKTQCLFLKATKQAIHNCEEFDSVPVPGEPEAARPDMSPIRLQRESSGQALPVGLCTNCDHRLKCMHRQPGVEVLQCEDYC